MDHIQTGQPHQSKDMSILKILQTDEYEKINCVDFKVLLFILFQRYPKDSKCSIIIIREPVLFGF